MTYAVRQLAIVSVISLSAWIGSAFANDALATQTRANVEGPTPVVAEAPIGAASEAGAAPAVDPDLGEDVRQGFVEDGKLVLLGGKRSAVSFDLRTGERKLIANGSVVEATRHGSQLWYLRFQPLRPVIVGSKSVLMVSTYDGQRFIDLPRVPVDYRGGFIALTSDTAGPMVIAEQAVHRWNAADRTWSSSRIDGPIKGATFTAVATSDGQTIYLAADEGEWGGGLQRLDIGTGRVEEIEGSHRASRCRRPIDKDCDVIRVITADPERPSCALVAVGLQHLSGVGSLLRACGTNLKKLYQEKNAAIGAGTEPILDLKRGEGKEFWFATRKTLIRSHGENFERFALKATKKVGLFEIMEVTPCLLVVLVDENPGGDYVKFAPTIVPRCS